MGKRGLFLTHASGTRKLLQEALPANLLIDQLARGFPMITTESRVRDARATRQAVLQAATRLFAASGYAGTSMRDIAEASGASQPLIHHHFGTKEQLYTEVKRQAIKTFAQDTPGMAQGGATPGEIRADMRRLYEFLRDNDALLRLAAWARLEGNHFMWPGEAELMQALCARIARAQKTRVLRQDMEPAHLAVMMVGLIYFWLDHREYYAPLFDGRPDDQAYLRDAVALVVRGAAEGALRAHAHS